MERVTVDGVDMWQSSDGERRFNPSEKVNTYGAHKIDVDGVVMWETLDGQRVKTVEG